MSEVTSLAASSPAFADDEQLRIAVSQLFAVFQRKYGPRWRDRFEDPKARPVWFASLRAAGVSADAVKLGLGQLSRVGTGWPPSDEEFIALCRPPSPPLAVAMREALAWARDTSLGFSHVAIAAAARSVGAWHLRTLDDRAVQSALGAAYRTALDRLARGESLDLPIRRALPAHIHRSIPHGQEPAAVAELRQQIARSLGLSS
jgi:hypothetical protein